MDKMIDVIIPIYRSEPYIKNCMLSLSRQTYRNFEVILVDNNTDDNSIPIAEKCLEKYGIAYRSIRAEKQGTSCAKNAGILAAKHEWLVCVDPDDAISPRFLEILLDNALKYAVDVSFSSYQIVGNENLFKGHSDVIQSEKIDVCSMLKHFLVRDIRILVPAMLIKRAFYENFEHMNNEDMRTGEDAYHLWIVIANHTEVAYCHTPLYNYYVRSGSLTTHIDIEKSMTCHKGFCELKQALKDTEAEPYIDMILARNDIALLHMAARHGRWNEYRDLRKAFNPKTSNMFLKEYPQFLLRVLTWFNYRMSWMFYLLSKKI